MHNPLPLSHATTSTWLQESYVYPITATHTFIPHTLQWTHHYITVFVNVAQHPSKCVTQPPHAHSLHTHIHMQSHNAHTHTHTHTHTSSSRQNLPVFMTTVHKPRTHFHNSKTVFLPTYYSSRPIIPDAKYLNINKFALLQTVLLKGGICFVAHNILTLFDSKLGKPFYLREYAISDDRRTFLSRAR